MTSRLHVNERRSTPPLEEIDRWRQFVGLLLPLMQTGRIDAAGRTHRDGAALAPAAGLADGIAREPAVAVADERPVVRDRMPAVVAHRLSRVGARIRARVFRGCVDRARVDHGVGALTCAARADVSAGAVTLRNALDAAVAGRAPQRRIAGHRAHVDRGELARPEPVGVQQADLARRAVARLDALGSTASETAHQR